MIGPDRPEAFRREWEKQLTPFAGLADPAHEVAKLYSQPVKLLKLGRLPALFLVDRSGAIRFEQFSRSMSDISENADLLAALDELPADA